MLDKSDQKVIKNEIREAIETFASQIISATAKGFEDMDKRFDRLEKDVTTIKEDVSVLKEDVSVLKSINFKHTKWVNLYHFSQN